MSKFVTPTLSVSSVSPPVVATHNGVFHADEVVAIATMMIALCENLKVFRTRDSKAIDGAKFVVDVGGVYDRTTRFDHHQQGFNEWRERSVDCQPVKGMKYASAGLVWEKFGGVAIVRSFPEIHFTRDQLNTIWQRVDDSIMAPVDAIDNGIARPDGSVVDFGGISLNALVGSFNRDPMDHEGQMDAFMEAVSVVKSILVARITSLVNEVLMQDAFKQDMEGYDGSGVLLLHDGNPGWRSVAAKLGISPTFVVFPKNTETGEYGIQTVPISPDKFTAKLDLPQAWAGLSGDNLTRALQADGLDVQGVFCHNGRFIMGVIGQVEAVRVALHVLNNSTASTT